MLCCDKLTKPLPRFCPVCGLENRLYPAYAAKQERDRVEFRLEQAKQFIRFAKEHYPDLVAKVLG